MVTLKGKLVSFQHSINFTRVQDVSINLLIIFSCNTKLMKCDSLKRVGVSVGVISWQEIA